MFNTGAPLVDRTSDPADEQIYTVLHSNRPVSSSLPSLHCPKRARLYPDSMILQVWRYDSWLQDLARWPLRVSQRRSKDKLEWNLDWDRECGLDPKEVSRPMPLQLRQCVINFLSSAAIKFLVS